MHKRPKLLFLLTTLGCALAGYSPILSEPLRQDPVPSSKTPAVETSDEALVRRAALDYVEAIYEVKPELIERSVHADLVKFGFWRPNQKSPYEASTMNKEQLLELARKWNASGRSAGPQSVKTVDVFDVLDQTAAAKVTAVWGVDYLQLARMDGRWQIRHILWQSPPPKKTAADAQIR